ncbi:MAG TPA: tRNA (adenosine(37)-N6)-threonylcarbamoyltransferase complex transferase subunit TsaD [Ignavibacteria bacterium]|nr:tRNA (adenosine(37)-N6)-threonylcarbamoyltransferase complex transferase subunit TsaD [Ignavibacteria bacterium]
MYILSFESSCDETSAAVLDNDKVLSNEVLSQMFHTKWGGVVPEIASREHLKEIVNVTRAALDDAKIGMEKIDAIACSNEPGLIGALLIGLSYAKSLALTLNKPFIPVNHIYAHLYSSFLNDNKPEFPFISLIVSGGHTLLFKVDDFYNHTLLGTTLDDAAGEAFDKVAKLMGLGYPGGPLIDQLAKKGDKNFHRFPLASLKNTGYDFSFSGIKTSVLYFLKKINFSETKNEKLICDICASFQDAVTESLVRTTLKAAEKFNINRISISGGVSANSELKEKFLSKKGYDIYIPELKYSTDNAGMIGIAAYYKYLKEKDKNIFSGISFSEQAKARSVFE